MGLSTQLNSKGCSKGNIPAFFFIIVSCSIDSKVIARLVCSWRYVLKLLKKSLYCLPLTARISGQQNEGFQCCKSKTREKNIRRLYPIIQWRITVIGNTDKQPSYITRYFPGQSPWQCALPCTLSHQISHSSVKEQGKQNPPPTQELCSAAFSSEAFLFTLSWQ